MNPEHVERCYLCDNAADRVQEPREITRGTRKATIDDDFYRCSSCGEEFYDGVMAEERNRKTAEALRSEDGLLQPGEVRAIRTAYGLSQAGLEKLIGAGEKTVIRWERGSTAQNATADTLLRVLRDHPEVVARLAEERGVRVRLPEKAPVPSDHASAGERRDDRDVEDVRHAA